MPSSERIESGREAPIRLGIALLTVAIVSFGYVVIRPVSLATGGPWLFVSVAPAAIYYFGTTGLWRTLVFGGLLVGITALGWADVVLAKEDDLSGVYPVAVLVATMATSFVGSCLSAAADRWRRQ